MPFHLKRLSHRIFLYVLACIISITAINFLAGSLIHRISTTSPTLFPVLTISLMSFHITIACFMAMKYLCDKKRLYLAPIAFAFFCSALLMLGTLSSYPDWLLCGQGRAVNQNDALIFYFFRNVMMAVLFTTSTILYYFRHRTIHSWKTHVIVLIGCIFFISVILTLSWVHSSHSPWLNIDFIDNLAFTFTPLWHSRIGSVLIITWSLTLILLIYVTQLRNIFWYSGAFFCSAYIFTLMMLLSSASSSDHSWNQARFFETLSTLFLILVLLCDVFMLYRESNNKYIHSYQNSIRDPLTRLYNRSYFYDTLNGLLPKVSASQPLSVIVSDLDHFKRINDNYGHVQGDKVIQFAASVLQNSVRQHDAAARIGGEEFALLLVNTDVKEALAIAERIRLTVSEERAELPERMTISMGVFTTQNTGISAEECVRRADEAMYEAKNNGRNRVVVWHE
ncbi:MAG: GGDEF domain-containing protein [Klebsiella huaxiensis]|uniref:sensor domain-containing diguanylate cyclase n=1 Tax=Klebsiella huaxiensis TaxID=2153354 RepID=UPI0026E9C837|nr:GGDEF domain-containing protein [Klebsiella huaxiensis]WEJ91522.1 MAG: GGDEF domain-containing protein [Klebsiella huaxiensis]